MRLTVEGLIPRRSARSACDQLWIDRALMSRSARLHSGTVMEAVVMCCIIGTMTEKGQVGITGSDRCTFAYHNQAR